jgi:hypothetical protein
LNLKSRIGEKVGPYHEDVPTERIDHFVRAVGSEVQDEAPPTFLTVFRQGEFDLFQKLSVSLSHVLHAEQEYVYFDPVRAGDRVTYETKLVQVLEKRGSATPLQFLVFETQFVKGDSLDGKHLATARSTVVVRGGNSDGA